MSTRAWVALPLWAGLAVASAPLPARAQSNAGAWLAVQGTSLNADSRYPTGTEKVSGRAIGGEGGLNWRLVSLRIGYHNGALTPDTSGPSGRDYIEGFAFLGVRPIPGLEISAGPRSRAYVRTLPVPAVLDGLPIGFDQEGTRESTQRWVTWEVHGRYEGALVPDLLGGYGEVWAAVAGNVSNAGKFDRGRGAEAGVIVYLARGLFGLRIGYALDETRLGEGAWRETVTGVRLAVAYGRR
jgi:hypothetical protein